MQDRHANAICCQHHNEQLTTKDFRQADIIFSSLFGKHSLFFEVPSTSSYEPSDVTLSKEINQQQIVNIFCPKIKTELSLYTRIYSSYPIFSSFSLIFFGFSSFAILSQSTLSYLLI